MTKLKIEWVAIEEIRPYEKRLRSNENTVEALVQLIEKIGFNVPIVIDQNRVIVKGDARYKAGLQMGMKELPCILSENTEEINNQDRIVDNRVSELSKWDTEKLIFEIDAISPELARMGLDFDIKIPTMNVREVDITNAEQVQDEIGTPDEYDALLSVHCPECGGFFEYKKFRED